VSFPHFYTNPMSRKNAWRMVFIHALNFNSKLALKVIDSSLWRGPGSTRGYGWMEFLSNILLSYFLAGSDGWMKQSTNVYIRANILHEWHCFSVVSILTRWVCEKVAQHLCNWIRFLSKLKNKFYWTQNKQKREQKQTTEAFFDWQTLDGSTPQAKSMPTIFQWSIHIST
jgi:hypothetical protein